MINFRPNLVPRPRGSLGNKRAEHETRDGTRSQSDKKTQWKINDDNSPFGHEKKARNSPLLKTEIHAKAKEKKEKEEVRKGGFQINGNCHRHLRFIPTRKQFYLLEVCPLLISRRAFLVGTISFHFFLSLWSTSMRFIVIYFPPTVVVLFQPQGFTQVQHPLKIGKPWKNGEKWRKKDHRIAPLSKRMISDSPRRE